MIPASRVSTDVTTGSPVFLIAVAAFGSPAGDGARADTATGLPTSRDRPPASAPTTLAPSLAARLAGADGPLPVLVTLRAQVPSDGYAGRPRELIRDLRRAAARSQPALLGASRRRRAGCGS